jgi:major intracellular serine protease
VLFRSGTFKLIPFKKNEIIRTLDYSLPYGINLVNAPYMWQNSYTGKDIVIAIIDTGCDINHPNLKDRIIDGKNFTTDYEGNPNIFIDENGHGTHVAGIIGAKDIGNGIVGVAPQSKLIILKALSNNGYGSYYWIINAINYAINKKVDIISLSLGGSDDITQLHDIIKIAINNNILVVCAAGNRGDNSDLTNEFDYPGSYEEVIEVGAIDENKIPASFNNSNSFLDLLAPGVNILSTFKNNSYATLSGTSMAAPFVSGCLALLIEWSRKEFNRSMNESEIYAQLIKNTICINYSRRIQGNGYIYLNPLITIK